MSQDGNKIYRKITVENNSQDNRSRHNRVTRIYYTSRRDIAFVGSRKSQSRM